MRLLYPGRRPALHVRPVITGCDSWWWLVGCGERDRGGVRDSSRGLSPRHQLHGRDGDGGASIEDLDLLKVAVALLDGRQLSACRECGGMQGDRHEESPDQIVVRVSVLRRVASRGGISGSVHKWGHGSRWEMTSACLVAIATCLAPACLTRSMAFITVPCRRLSSALMTTMVLGFAASRASTAAFSS
jgi:hypothetical protein